MARALPVTKISKLASIGEKERTHAEELFKSGVLRGHYRSTLSLETTIDVDGQVGGSASATLPGTGAVGSARLTASRERAKDQTVRFEKEWSFGNDGMGAELAVKNLELEELLAEVYEASAGLTMPVESDSLVGRIRSIAEKIQHKNDEALIGLTEPDFEDEGAQ